MQGIKTVVLEIRVFMSFLREKKTVLPHSIFFLECSEIPGNSANVGKLPNHVNTIFCVIIFLCSIFFSIFATHKSGNFIHIPINTNYI